MTPPPRPELKVKEYAALERVAEKTVRRWIDKGVIDARRTPGGGLRIGATRVFVVGTTRSAS